MILGNWLILIPMAAALAQDLPGEISYHAASAPTQDAFRELARDSSRMQKDGHFAISPDRPAFIGRSDTVFPHFANGGGWETLLVLVNIGNTTVKFDQEFRSQSGSPLPVTFRTYPEGEIVTTAFATGTLPAGSSFRIVLYDTGQPVQIGWSALNYDTSNGRLGGFAIFRLKVSGRPDFEALVPLSAYDDSEFYMPYDNLEGFVTSLALLNPVSPGGLTTTVRATVLDARGNTLSTSNLTLTPGQQMAFAIPDQFPATRSRTGVIRFSGSTNRLSALGFRFNPGGAFATVPIQNWSGMF